MKKQLFFIGLVILQTFSAIRASEYFKHAAIGTAVLLGIYGLKAFHESGELDQVINSVASVIVSLSENDTTQPDPAATMLIERQKATHINRLTIQKNKFSNLNNHIRFLQTRNSTRMERLAASIIKPFQTRHPLQSKTVALTRRINNQINYINDCIANIHRSQEDNLTNDQIEKISELITILNKNFELFEAEYNQLLDEETNLTDQDLLTAMSSSSQ